MFSDPQGFWQNVIQATVGRHQLLSSLPRSKANYAARIALTKVFRQIKKSETSLSILSDSTGFNFSFSANLLKMSLILYYVAELSLNPLKQPAFFSFEMSRIVLLFSNSFRSYPWSLFKYYLCCFEQIKRQECALVLFVLEACFEDIYSLLVSLFWVYGSYGKRE